MDYTEREKRLDVLHKQTYNIVKANALIQKSRFDLSLSEQKIVLRLIQMVQPQDEVFKEYTIDIQEFCDICGIDRESGKNYLNIRNAIDKLSDKKFWLITDDKGTLSQCRWICKPRIKPHSGEITVRLDDDLIPYLLNLKQNFTTYSFYNILAMKSKYSPRLYELLKSEQYKRCFKYDLSDLKRLLNAERYELYGNFKQKVLDIALKEINETTDIYVEYEPIRTKKKYTAIRFTVRAKTTDENVKTLIDRKAKER